MADKKVIYKEPASYFNADMKKVVKEWEQEQKAKAKAETPKKKGK